MKDRFLFAVLAVALLLPSASAGYGPMDEAGWPVNIHGESVAPEAENRVGPVTAFPYYPILAAEVQRLAAEYPDRVKLHVAGQSTAGLDIFMLEIADWDALEGDNGAVPLEEREVVWVDGGTHSNEYSGVYFTLAVAQYLIEESDGTDELASWIVANRHTWIMPMVNVDGSNAMGRLNANLVNINRNYPVVWDGEGNDALMNNRGPHPASEVETQLTIEWYNLTQPDYLASVHCCGNLWLYPYGEEGVDPPADDFAMLETVCEQAFPDVREACGPIWSTIYPASGSSVDTAYEYTGAVSFGYEMSGRGGGGLWGAPFTMDPVRQQEYESWDGLMHAFENVHRYGAHPTVTSVHSKGDYLLATVHNEGLRNLTDGSLRVGDASVPLPFMAPGATELVPIPAPRGVDESVLSVEYTKRTMAEPTGSFAIPLAFTGDVAPPGGLLVLEANGSQDTPGLPVVAGIAMVGLALALRRR